MKLKLKKHYLLIFLFLLIGIQCSIAQNYTYNYSIPVTQFGHELKFPFVGGLNNPQFSHVDMNQDGLKDLFIFDRTGNKTLVLINEGGENEIDYFYWQQYEQQFPALLDWAILIDYNCDGLEDIITGYDLGVKTYLGNYDGSSVTFSEDVSKLQFTEAGLLFDLAVGYIDIPGFADVDFDGDIDVLTFNIVGGIVDYYINTQIEDGLPCGTLALQHINSCWGNFYESGLKYAVDLDYACKGVTKTTDGVHTGSTFMVFDEDADNDMDIVLGDLAYGNLNKLVNGGDKDFAHIIDQDTLFPNYDFPYNVAIFPAPFLLDINNDNKKDMLVSPNNINLSENHKNVAYYQNISDDDTYVFNFQTDSLFVSDMIDLGEGAYPIFFDYNYDGLQDLVIGNYGYYVTSDNIGKLALYKNTGTATAPAFTLITLDFAGISEYQFLSLVPTFADLDNDGDEDMLLGESNGFVHYFKNIAPPEGPAQFILFAANYQGIDPGANSAPQLIDVSGDGLVDLIIGEKNGNLNYYENTGAADAPIFTLQNEFWGNVDVRTIGVLTGHAIPFLTKLNTGNYQLYIGCEAGTIYLYEPTPDFTGEFTKVTSALNNIDEGAYSSVQLKDINGDGLADMVTGNQRGGITFYRDENALSNNTIKSPYNNLLIYPNPAENMLNIEGLFSKNAQLVIYSIDGKVILQQTVSNTSNKITCSVAGLNAGLYFIEIRNADNSLSYIAKFIKH